MLYSKLFNICGVIFVDNNLYQNGANHHGFIYQNPKYNRQTTYRSTDDYATYKNLKLATIYVKPQIYNTLNSPAEALKQGTAFPELYRPFVEKTGGIRR